MDEVSNPTTEKSNDTPTSGENQNNPTKSDDKNNDKTISDAPIDNIPKYIDVYIYDADGYYIKDDIAERSPEDKEAIYLMPPNSTKEKPPVVEKGKIQKWNGTNWNIVDNPTDDQIDTIEKLRKVLNEQQIKIDNQEKEIDDLRQLMSGLIVSSLKTS